MIQCTKCYGTTISEELWVDCVSGEVVDRNGHYYCSDCGSMTDVVETNDDWIEDVTPLEDEKELTVAPKQKI